jgi:hypothetical protein
MREQFNGSREQSLLPFSDATSALARIVLRVAIAIMTWGIIWPVPAN